MRSVRHVQCFIAAYVLAAGLSPAACVHRVSGQTYDRNQRISQSSAVARHDLAIVYLAQKSHSSYGRDSMTLLTKSIDLLYKNVIPWTPADVIVFHEGDFTESDHQRVFNGRDGRFEVVPSQYWTLPSFLSAADLPSWVGPHFSVGYRHMIRWYGIMLFRHMEANGYRWVMRLDEESYVLSPIRYNMVHKLVAMGAQYGYRQDMHDGYSVSTGFGDLIRAYYTMKSITNTTMLQHCNPKDFRGLTTEGWTRHGPYNNFFIANVTFFTTSPVREMLDFVDRSGGIYTHRWNDILIHAAATETFLTERQMYKFQDFTYEHSTLSKDDKTLLWGGLTPGTDDPDAQRRVKSFVEKYGAHHKCIEEDHC